MSRFRYCRRAFLFQRGRVGFLNRIGNTGFAVETAVAGFLNASDFVVNEMEDAVSFISVLDQVAMSIELRIFLANQS